VTSEPEGDRRSILERLLSPIAEVRRGEGVGVLLLALNLFLVLAAYYMLKTIRESLILAEGGAAVKSYSAAGQALLLLGLVPAFGAFASRVNRIRLVRWVTLFFVSNIGLFFVAGRFGLSVGVPYFLWVGIFNVMVIAQFWAFVNDVYTPDQGKRLFPIVGLGSSLGAWLGSLYAGDVIRATGPFPLMLVAAGVLVGCVVVVSIVDRRQLRAASPQRAAEATQPLQKVGGFALIRQQRYLMLIALMTVFLNIVNTSGEYLFGRFIVDASVRMYGAGASSLAARQQFIGGVYGTFFSYVNLTGFLLQLLVVSRVFKYLGVGRALFIHPLVALTGYLFVLKAPSVGVMTWLKTVDNSIDYSLGNTAKQALWLPTSREAKYKAKQAIDSFFMRTGDVLQAGIVFVGERLAFTVQAFAGINVMLALGWIAVVVALNPAYRAQVTAMRSVSAPVGADPAVARQPDPPGLPEPSSPSRRGPGWRPGTIPR
jgi:ATP:ADP antiporter, AAA family